MAPVAVYEQSPTDRKTILVVGLGMVGIAFIEKILALDEEKRYRIVTCGEERHLAYNRVALTEYFQHRSVEELYLNSPAWYAEQDPERFTFHVGEQVTKLDYHAQCAKTSKNRIIPYDLCILATGSEASLPPYVTPETSPKTRGIFVYRSIADLDAMLAYSDRPEVKKAVVVGGGLLGLEAAKALYDLPAIPDVAIINRQAYPLSRQLDSEAGEMVLRKIEGMGVKVITKVNVTNITTEKIPEAEIEYDGKSEVMTGFDLADGTRVECDLAVFAIGIKSRDDLARSANIECHPRGGVIVNDDLSTSAPNVYAIGECTSWKGNTYGLIAPGVEMADILSFNLTQTYNGAHKPRKMNDPDLSTKLKLMGVDVASFGDFFADQRMQERMKAEEVEKDKVKQTARSESNGKAPVWELSTSNTPSLKVENGDRVSLASNGNQKPANGRRIHRHRNMRDEPIKCLTYKDPFSSVYKKYIFSADGKYLLGGMMIGDTSDYVKLVAIVKKKKALDVPPSQFIVGASKGGDDDGADLDDDTQICSCHNVTKGQVVDAVKNGVDNIGDIKLKTKAGTGCGGCIPLVTNIFKAEMKKAGKETNNNLCVHFPMSRTDLFNVVKIKQLKTFNEIVDAISPIPKCVGCETCKPVIGSILSSLYNEHIMDAPHHQLQDTNDRYLANIQRNGTFSVIPRVAGGEITPDGLIVIGQIAKKYNLYTKITGGQRIDMFGAQKQDLPDIWEQLVDAGFESGHAYGKSLRTVKSCVGTTWCRYGVGDSVGLAIQLEERYKGVRSPHKIKGGVSGCIRECAEAQSKDFGLIATDKGWNIYLAGNGGSTPRHATLFATDVPPSKVVRIIDRFLMFYIRTADKLMRTARWIEQFEGGVEKLKKIILDDELGICADLDREMDALVGTYQCEWTTVVKNPERRKQFRQFVNSDERQPQIEPIVERGQTRPADWPKEFPPVKFNESDISSPKSQWTWQPLVKTSDMNPTSAGTTSAVAKYGDTQLAIFNVPGRGYFATQQMCPHKRAFVLDHGIIGDDANGNLHVSCPLHKRNFGLKGGNCSNDPEMKILTFDAQEKDGMISVLLPDSDALDSVIGTSKWMVRQATAQVYGKGSAGMIEIIGPDGRVAPEIPQAGCVGGSSCGDSKLEW
ncbi:nitrite reductase (NAD(P)H) large subunit [Rhizoctonia solani AG-1 IB]|uniref:Nitrite reductase [NAD(P)H] n=1 Tax=Thanatephorus cucumeris (strain AG1-IB / isolate 7/3/14) TaxID=1108050 RepID=A0A0B7F0C3_THACB|nr:nitrite reductase (NAD(P)H) large subunit [Rhizoctonia solani AG-1 IB]